MAIQNYYFGSPDGIGNQMVQDRATAAQLEAERMRATMQALQQMATNRDRMREGALDRAERRYASDASGQLSRDLARGTTTTADLARLEQGRQFGLTQQQAAEHFRLAQIAAKEAADRAHEDAKTRTAAIIRGEEIRAGADKPQIAVQNARSKAEVDQWNATARGVESNLNARLDFLDADEIALAKKGGDWGWGLGNNEKAARVAAEKRAAAERELFANLDDAVTIYVTSTINPATGKRRFRANTRTAPELDVGPAEPGLTPPPAIANPTNAIGTLLSTNAPVVAPMTNAVNTNIAAALPAPPAVTNQPNHVWYSDQELRPQQPHIWYPDSELRPQQPHAWYSDAELRPNAVSANVAAAMPANTSIELEHPYARTQRLQNEMMRATNTNPQLDDPRVRTQRVAMADDMARLASLGRRPPGTVYRSRTSGISYQFNGSAWQPVAQ